jgi:hypothetical protein
LLGDTVHLLNGQQVVLVTASIDNSEEILPGTITRCTIDTGSLTLREYLIGVSQTIFQ